MPAALHPPPSAAGKRHIPSAGQTLTHKHCSSQFEYLSPCSLARAEAAAQTERDGSHENPTGQLPKSVLLNSGDYDDIAGTSVSCCRQTRGSIAIFIAASGRLWLIKSQLGTQCLRDMRGIANLHSSFGGLKLAAISGSLGGSLPGGTLAPRLPLLGLCRCHHRLQSQENGLTSPMNQIFSMPAVV